MSSETADRGSRAAVAVRDWLRQEEDSAVGLLGDLTELESPTTNPELLDAFAARLVTLFAPLGEAAIVERGGLHHVHASVGPPNGTPAPLVLTHYDTVWPAGTAARRPFSVDNGSAHGPGVFDLKAGTVIAYYALRGLLACGLVPQTGVRLLLCADEERGNPTSADLIAQLATGASAALVLEPPLEAGRLKTRRKGVAHAILQVEGRAAHAAASPGTGVSAALEAARLALEVAKLNDASKGVSVNVGLLRAGEQRNVVAPSGVLELDVRAPDLATLEQTLERLRRMRPANRDARITVDARIHRPPWEPSDGTHALLELAQTVGAGLGLELGHGASGGGSEANLTAAAGVPTLDGLGASGHGAHAEDEMVELASIFERTALLAGLLVAIG